MMTLTTRAKAIIGVALILSAAIIVWQVQSRRARAASLNLTTGDMALVASGLSAESRAQLAESKDARQALAHKLRDMLALAEEAKAAGIANDPAVKNALDVIRSEVIAKSYATGLRRSGTITSSEQLTSPTEVDAFLKEPGQDARFDDFVKSAQKTYPALSQKMTPEQLEPEQRELLKRSWAQLFIVERKALAAGTDKDRETKLQIRLQQARLLSTEYFNKILLPKIKASDAEIHAYLLAHPEPPSSTDADNPAASHKSGAQQARQAVEREKGMKLFDDIRIKSSVQVADDFQVPAPTSPAVSQGSVVNPLDGARTDSEAPPVKFAPNENGDRSESSAHPGTAYSPQGAGGEK
jgi:hypothetical protein